MKNDEDFQAFIAAYSQPVADLAWELRKVVVDCLPEIIEQIDGPAKMVAYCYGQQYDQMICTIIPSKKGLKLGFYRGVDLPDPDHLLEGSAKTSRYIVISGKEQIRSHAVTKLLERALVAYRQRMR